MSKITAASLREKHPFYAAILDGEFDGEGLEDIQHAIVIRKKTMFRPGAKVRLSGTKNVNLEGKTGEVIRVGPKRISVGIGPKDQWGYQEQYNVPVRMLEVV